MGCRSEASRPRPFLRKTETRRRPGGLTLLTNSSGAGPTGPIHLPAQHWFGHSPLFLSPSSTKTHLATKAARKQRLR
ncbi:hypothetical protein HPP92_009930 [Vanilla planifolia]|nr:hypothetical protein HPP92_009930 [Vanilla planifolia]